MPATNYVVFADISTPPPMSSNGDTLTVLAAGSLVAPSTALDANAFTGQSVSILGYVDLNYIWQGGSGTVAIGATGTFVGHSSTCIYLGTNLLTATEIGSNRVENAGTIRADQNGVGVFGFFNQIVNTGLITATQNGVYTVSGGGSSAVQNSGTILTRYAFGIELASELDSIANSGSVISSFSIGIHLVGQSQHLANTGLVEGKSNAVEITGIHSEIVNSGNIIAKVGNGLAFYTGLDAKIANYGTITGGTSGVVDAHTTALSLVNQGIITGQSGAGVAATSPAADGSHIVNSGMISGATYSLQMGIGVDTVINTGTLNGDVLLGAGDDVIDTRRGDVMGAILGGDGSDTYMIGDASLALVEGVGLVGDKDTVKSTVSYQLETNFEILTLLGSHNIDGAGTAAANTLNGNAGDNRLTGLAGADSLYGNMGDDRLLGGLGLDLLSGGDGDDSLIGGAGKDALTGGAGSDSFIFVSVNDTGATVANADTITDFVQGDDLIDLSRIDAIKSNAASNDTFTFIGSNVFSGAAGEVRFAISGGVTTVEFNRTADLVADGVIKLTGIHTLTAADFVL